jgi:hypothetical protein
MNFSDLHNQIVNQGFTALSNPLEDLLLRELPNDYYRFWRFVWRKTIGWQRLVDNISMRQISEGANIHISAASRAAWFFHSVQMIRYTPGLKGRAISQIRILPCLAPEYITSLEKMIAMLREVLSKESQMRGRNKNFRYTNEQFRSELANCWKQDGGQVAEQPPAEACA